MGVDNDIAALAGCLVCVVLATALISVQNQAREPLGASWNQLIALIAPVRLTVFQRSTHRLADKSHSGRKRLPVEVAETLARMQLNMKILYRILAVSDEWAPPSALKDVRLLRRQRFLFQCSVVLIRAPLIWWSLEPFTDKIAILTVQSYSQFVSGLLALHEVHHAVRFRALAVACGCTPEGH